MKIEDINSSSIKKESNKELYNMPHRFAQLYNKNLKGRQGGEVGGLGRFEFIDKYQILIREMNRRGLTYRPTTDLDIEAFRKAMTGVGVKSLGDQVVVSDYISIGGSFVKRPKDANDLDIIIRDFERNRDEGLELKVGRALKKQTGKDLHFVYAPRGPHSSYLPLFDLVVRAKDKLRRVDIKESTQVKLKRAVDYYEGLENWGTDLLCDNAHVIESLSKGSVLDIGCGSGKLLKLLEEDGHQVMGLDVDKNALKLAEKKKLDIKEHDLDKGLPFEDNSFDNVTAVHVLEHVSNPKALSKEMERVARKKAVVIVPLGERQDPTHKHKYKDLSQFKKILNKNWETYHIKPSNAVLAVLAKKIEKAKKLSPFGGFKPPKPSMSGMTEAFDVSQIWDWAKDRKLVAEPKLNGFRMVIAKKGSSYRIYTDSKKNRAKHYPSLKDEITKVKEDFMLDCSMGIERDGKPLPRIKLMTLMADKPKLGEKDKIVCTVFDLPFWKEDLHTTPFKERRKKLEAFYSKYLKSSNNFEITKCETIKNKSDLEKTFKKFAKLPQSEGVVVKGVKSIWDVDGSIEGWAKLKVEAEIKVMVIKRHSVKGGKHNYTCGVLKGDGRFENITRVGDMELINLGKTYNTKISAKPGDILTIGIEEIIPKEKKLDWLGPRVLDKDEGRKEPYYANQVVEIAEKANILQKGVAKKKDDEGTSGVEGNMDFEEGDSGDAVAQLHIMGIEKKELEDLLSIKGRAKVARADLKKLERLLKDKIGEQGAHIDVRFHRKKDKYWEGGEIMIGNLSGLDKIYGYKKGQSLRFGWKVPRVGEAKIEVIRGPMNWMKAGADKIEVFEPGEVGATANMYAAMLRVDKFNWSLYMADEHAKKFHITDSRFFGGNWLMAYVPVTERGKKGKRVWMMRKLDKDDHKKKEKADASSPFFKFFKVNKKEFIVGGVVYSANDIDTQGDAASSQEVWKALKKFMIKGGNIKVMHKGRAIKSPVVECYQAEEDHHKGGTGDKHLVKTGDWYLSVYLGDEKDIWKDVVEGKLNGFSMGGTAKSAN